MTDGSIDEWMGNRWMEINQDGTMNEWKKVRLEQMNEWKLDVGDSEILTITIFNRYCT